MISRPLIAVLLCSSSMPTLAIDYETEVKPLLANYCHRCHSGKDANGDTDLSAIQTTEDVLSSYESLESAIELLSANKMPPADEKQPTGVEKQLILNWYHQLLQTVKTRPAIFRSRRLSVDEYRNSLQSVVGFDLEVDVIEAEQTVSERSMVIKLLPTDPPGDSGFKNDTHKNALTPVVWDQYSYLVDAALEELFTDQRTQQLRELSGADSLVAFSSSNLRRLIEQFSTRAWRRPPTEIEVARIMARLENRSGSELTAALKLELKSILMSPSFIYRGLRQDQSKSGRQLVDHFELAERLSYFLWADMPDQELMKLAGEDRLNTTKAISTQVDRMLKSAKAKTLATVFATEWFTLNEIEHVSNNPPVMVAMKSQPLDYLHWMFTNNRPVIELVDSDTTFINPHIARHYGKDAQQMTRYRKQRGIEVEIIPNQKIKLIETKERGGLLTMPGILAMNKGPIIRGTWMLERILGDDLPEPPANIGQVPANRQGENLSFRQRFEQHRSNPTCAVCHDKIDPLGFALQRFGPSGSYIGPKYKPTKKELRKGKALDPNARIDTSGKLPTGEKFRNMAELKRILTTSQREAVVRNVVRRTMSYALARRLTIYDHPVVEEITEQLSQQNGTWTDLFKSIAISIPFRETIILRRTESTKRR